MAWFTREKKASKITALHIDDSRWVRIPVAILLQREFGMRVLEAESGAEGISIAQQERPDIILLDVMMPQLDGFDTLHQLKEHHETRSSLVLMCTARNNVREVNMALRLGAFGYLTKPIEEDHLVAQIKKVLAYIEKKQKAGGSVHEFKEQLQQPVHEVLVPSAGTERPDAPLTVAAGSGTVRHCPRCRQNLEMIKQYNAWYCHACQMYPDFEKRT